MNFFKWLRNCFKEDEEHKIVDLVYLLNYRAHDWSTVIETNVREIEYLKGRGYVVVGRDTYKIQVANWKHQS